MAQRIAIDDITVDIQRRATRFFRCRLQPRSSVVCVSVPWRATHTAIMQFITAHMPWIKKNLARHIVRQNILHPQIVQGQKIWLWGQCHTLHIQPISKHISPLERVSVCPPEIRLFVTATTPVKTQGTYWEAWRKQELMRCLQQVLPLWEERLNLHPVKITARTMSTRWGSCSPHNKTIRLCTALVALNPIFLEYVLVHELLHLYEQRHNAHFYELMETYIPKWKALRRALLKIGS